MKDIHSESDARNIKIDYIGIDELRMPVVFASDNRIYNSIATINSGVSLEKNQKGAHLSRIVEVFNEKLDDGLLTISKLDDVLDELSKRVESDDVFLDIKMPLLMTSVSPVSKKLSYVDTLVELSSCKCNNEIEKKLGVSLNGAMCCPNSKAISNYGAHSQRCLLKVTFNGNINNIVIEDVVACMESSFSAPVRSVVKSIDEKYLTERAYENPKFSEDLIRDALLGLSSLYSDVGIEAESINFESIHSHNVRARGKIQR